MSYLISYLIHLLILAPSIAFLSIPIRSVSMFKSLKRSYLNSQIETSTVDNSELLAGPSALNVSSYNSLLDQFSDVSNTLILPFPSKAMKPTNRFKRLRFDGLPQLYFEYTVRESFRLLLAEVEELFSYECCNEAIRYVGNVGAGKSHNLAALAIFLQMCKSNKLGFDKDVVYVSSCRYLFYTKVELMAAALAEAFSNDKEKLIKIKEWSEIVEYIETKPKQSILFIFDDWHFTLREADVSKLEEEKRYLLGEDLRRLSSDQYRIEAISAFTPVLTSISSQDKNPILTKYFRLYGGLTEREWAARKARSAFISSLTAEEEAKLRDYTGGVPLYLNAIESYEGDLRERIKSFDTSPGIDIVANLERSSAGYAAVYEREFMQQMRNAVTREAKYQYEPLYDHRYFYRDSKHILRPVSGFVREAMREILRDFATKAYYRQLDKPWIDKAMSIGNDAVKEFAFKTYVSFAVSADPSWYLEGVPRNLTSCTVKFFDGNYPDIAYMARKGERGLTLFRPRQPSLRYVDAVARYVPEQGSEAGVTIYPIFATLQSFSANKDVAKFFKDTDGQACDAMQYIHPHEASKATFKLTYIGFRTQTDGHQFESDMPPFLAPDHGIKCLVVTRYTDITQRFSWGNVQVITNEHGYYW